jgi:hypothetical protein
VNHTCLNGLRLGSKGQAVYWPMVDYNSAVYSEPVLQDLWKLLGNIHFESAKLRVFDLKMRLRAMAHVSIEYCNFL